MADLPGQGSDDADRVLAVDLDQQDESRVALDQGRDVGVVRARDQVPFPVTGHRPILHLGRPLPDGRGVDDPAAALAGAAGVPAAAHRAHPTQMGHELLLRTPRA